MVTHPARFILLAALSIIALATEGPAIYAQTPQLAGKPVDACRLLTTAEASEVMGTKVEAEAPETPQGSLLGGCKYPSTSGVILLNARPAAEFDATVRSMRDASSVDAGAGAKAHYSKALGLVMMQTGKPYFVHVIVVG